MVELEYGQGSCCCCLSGEYTRAEVLRMPELLRASIIHSGSEMIQSKQRAFICQVLLGDCINVSEPMPDALLEYARFYRLAIDHHSTDVAGLLRFHTQQLSTENELRPSSLLADILRLHDGNAQVHKISHEKMFITATVAQRLQQAIKQPSLNVIEDCANSFLPSHRSLRSLKVSKPLLLAGGGDVAKDSARARRGIDTTSVLQSIRDDCGSLPFAYSKVAAEVDELCSVTEKLTKEFHHQIENCRPQIEISVLRRLATIVHVKQPEYDEIFTRKPPVLLPHDIKEDDYPNFCVPPEPCPETATPTSSHDDQHDTKNTYRSFYMPTASPTRTHKKLGGQLLGFGSDVSTSDEDFREFINWDYAGAAPCQSSDSSSPLHNDLSETADTPLQYRDYRKGSHVKASLCNMHVAVPKLTSNEHMPRAVDAVNMLGQYTLSHAHHQADVQYQNEMDNTLTTLPSAEKVLAESCPCTDNSLEKRLANPTLVVRSEHYLGGKARRGILDLHETSYHDLDVAIGHENPYSSSMMNDNSSPEGNGGIPSSVELVPKDLDVRPLLPVDIPSTTQQLQNIGVKRKVSGDVWSQAPFFSATASLSSYLDLRGRKFKRLRMNTNHIAQEQTDDPIESTQGSSSASTTKCDIESETLTDPIEIPAILSSLSTTLSDPCSIVLNTEMLLTRPALVSFLEAKKNNLLSIIYRDFHSSFEAVPHIILDAKSCILITNSQSLMQRSLPGQQNDTTTTSITHQTVQTLSESFEIVFVIVLQHIMPSRGKTQPESEIRVQFASFCASLKENTPELSVQPIWLKYTNTTKLAELLNAQVWSLITRDTQAPPRSISNHLTPCTTTDITTTSNKSVPVMTPDETQAELFLRKAGVNCVAAQVILSTLARPRHPNDATTTTITTMGCVAAESGIKTTSIASSSLARLISMKAQERSTIFSELVGGRAVNKLNCMLDGPDAACSNEGYKQQ